MIIKRAIPALAALSLATGGLTGCADEGWYEVGPGNWYETTPTVDAAPAEYAGGLSFKLDVAYYEAACDDGGTADDASDDYWYSLVYAPGMIHYYWVNTPGSSGTVPSAAANATLVVDGIATSIGPDFMITGASSHDLLGAGLQDEAGAYYDYIYAEFYSIGDCPSVAAATGDPEKYGEVSFYFTGSDMLTGDVECGATLGLDINTGLPFGTGGALTNNANITCGNF